MVCANHTIFTNHMVNAILRFVETIWLRTYLRDRVYLEAFAFSEFMRFSEINLENIGL